MGADERGQTSKAKECEGIEIKAEARRASWSDGDGGARGLARWGLADLQIGMAETQVGSACSRSGLN